jgi:hypothetical protein
MESFNFHSLCVQIAEKYDSNISPQKGLLLCLFFDALRVAEFLNSDQVLKLLVEQKRDSLVKIGNVYLRDYLVNEDILNRVKSDQTLINHLDVFTDIASYIISFCDQAGSEEALLGQIKSIPAQIQKVVEEL